MAEERGETDPAFLSKQVVGLPVRDLRSLIAHRRTLRAEAGRT
jgi:hypothetical protein